MSVRVTVTGHLTNDPQQRQAQNGNQYTTVSVAGNEHSRNGDEAFYFGAMFFGKRGETVLNYHKGDLVSMTGHLHEYQGNDGNTYKQLNYAEIELLHQKQNQQQSNNNQANYNQQPSNNGAQSNQEFNKGQQPVWNGQPNNYQSQQSPNNGQPQPDNQNDWRNNFNNQNGGNGNINLDDLPFN